MILDFYFHIYHMARRPTLSLVQLSYALGEVHIIMATQVLDVNSMLPNKFEPKRKTRFLLAIEGIDSFIVTKAKRPSVESEVQELPFINSYRKLAGMFKWGDMEVTLLDPIAPSGAQQVMEWIRLHFESVSGRAGYADFYKRDIQIKTLGPIGEVIELWDIRGALIKSANFGDLAYGEAGAVEITLTLAFDNCVLQF